MRSAILPILLIAVLGAAARTQVHAQRPPAAPRVSAAGTFTFAAGSAASDQQLFLGAVAAANPQARRLIDLVDGWVTVSFGSTGAGSLGRTSGAPGHYDVKIDTADTYAQLGERGIVRVVLHELGHVVDFSLVPPEIERELDAEIPKGIACDPGLPNGACTPRAERFAETFARWASGDIGYDLWVGYKVQPPSVPLAQWGAPLTRLH